MTFSEDMLIRRSQSQSLCSYAFTLSRPSKKDVHNWSLTAVFSFLSQCRELFSVFFIFSTALNGDAWRHYWILSLTFLFYNEKSPPLGDVGDKPKSEKLSKPMAQRFSPPSSGANTVCCAALITRSRGTLLGGLHDDSQSEVFYYAIFISSKTGLGGWSQWSMKMY